MLYCRVEKNKVVQGPSKLPKNWMNVSGFDLDLENAKKYGWLPVIVTEPIIPLGHKRNNRIINIINDIVYITWDTVALSKDEVLKINKSNLVKYNKTLPDYMESHIRNDHGGVVSDANLQKLYDGKMALRNLAIESKRLNFEND